MPIPLKWNLSVYKSHFRKFLYFHNKLAFGRRHTLYFVNSYHTHRDGASRVQLQKYQIRGELKAPLQWPAISMWESLEERRGRILVKYLP